MIWLENTHHLFYSFLVQEIKPKKESAQRNVLASMLRVQRKVVRTINESMGELTSQSKSIWWSRWIPKEE
jgi:hypothetical protein